MKKTLLTSVLLLIVAVSNAQDPPHAATKISRDTYISLVAPIAIEQQQLYGIPASITIAQGVLESGAGNSYLATTHNNHFGIKCKSSWTGNTGFVDDDAPQECFRSYGSVEESYIDHSLFLRGNERYAKLFDLDPTDYEGWANGLKDCGYATDPAYARKLIGYIETLGLNRLDNGTVPTEYLLASTNPPAELVTKYGTMMRTGTPLASSTPPQQAAAQASGSDTQPPMRTQQAQQTPQQIQQAPQQPQQAQAYQQSQQQQDGILRYQVGKINGRRFIVAKRGDTFAVLARMVGFSETRLREYNAKLTGQPRDGDFIFLSKPKAVTAE